MPRHPIFLALCLAAAIPALGARPAVPPGMPIGNGSGG